MNNFLMFHIQCEKIFIMKGKYISKEMYFCGFKCYNDTFKYSWESPLKRKKNTNVH